MPTSPKARAVAQTMIRLEKLRFFRKREFLRDARPVATALAAADVEQRRLHATSTFANGTLPTNFSITIGVAPCNYSCLFCPQSVSKPKKATWLDIGLLRKCLSEMPETGILLNVSSYSETIAAPNLVASIRAMKEVRPGLEIVMASNGSLFRQKVVEDLIDAGLDIYQYSFDAPTKDSYHRLIQVDNFEKAKRNLEQIIELRNKKNSKMKIYTHIMHYEGVEQDYETFRDLWKGKVDAVILRPMGNWGSGELMRTMADRGFTAAHKAPGKRYPCNSVFMHFLLEPTGHYAPCLPTTANYVTDPKYALGHASEMTWGEAWRKISAMRRAHLAGRWDTYEVCKNCNLWSLWPDIWTESLEGRQRFSTLVPHAD